MFLAMTEPLTFMRACRFMQLERRYDWGRHFPDSQGNTGFLGIGFGKK
jgi:hypothetical protein